MVSVVLYPCILCAQSTELVWILDFKQILYYYYYYCSDNGSVCIVCCVFVNCLVNQFAIYLGVVTIWSFNVI